MQKSILWSWKIEQLYSYQYKAVVLMWLILGTVNQVLLYSFLKTDKFEQGCQTHGLQVGCVTRWPRPV